MFITRNKIFRHQKKQPLLANKKVSAIWMFINSNVITWKSQIVFDFVNNSIKQVHRRELAKENNNCTVSNKSCSEEILIGK